MRGARAAKSCSWPLGHLATWASGLLGLRGHAKWSLPMAIKEPKTFCVLLPVRGMSLIVAAAAAADVATRNS